MEKKLEVEEKKLRRAEAKELWGQKGQKVKMILLERMTEDEVEQDQLYSKVNELVAKYWIEESEEEEEDQEPTQS